MIICAEIGLQHTGCLGTAFAFVDAVKAAGVDCVKAQNHLADRCNSFRPGTFFPQDKTRLDYWRRTNFTPQQWKALADHAHDRGLLFSCSVFSLAGVEMMAPLVDKFKVPSSKTNDMELLKALAAVGKPVVISTGMSDEDELERAALYLRKLGCTPTILQCTSEYPCQPERIGSLDDLRSWWGEYNHAPWGLSDHSGAIWPGIAAATLGADMLEIHCCWSKQQWGPDVSSSLTIDELKQLVDGVRFVEKMRASTISKDELAKELEPVRRVFRGS